MIDIDKFETLIGFMVEMASHLGSAGKHESFCVFLTLLA